MKIKDFKCKCGHNDFYLSDKASRMGIYSKHCGIYCSYCGKWLKWADKDEQNLAMKQEPKSEWEQDHAILKAYSDGVNEVLDKIRAEIEAKCYITVGREDDGAITLYDVFEIIDKYKAESENP